MKPLTPFAGVEVDFCELEDNDSNVITNLLQHHGVALIRNTDYDSDRFADLTRSLGKVVHPPFIPEVRNSTGVAELHHTAQAKEWRHDTSVVFASAWHQDWSFLEQPPHISLLLCREAPEAGGDTLLCDTSYALTRFSSHFVDYLRTLSAHHVSSKTFSPQGNYGTRTVIGVESVDIDAPELTALHPLVTRSHLSDQKCFFASPAYTTKIAQLTRHESENILRIMYEPLLWDEHLIRINWQPGSLLAWDNYRFLHRALNEGIIGRRHLLRSNVRR